MDADCLKSCAGIPTRTERLDARTALYSYENKYERTGGAEVTLPIIGGGFSLGGSGSYCHAIVRVVDGRVAAVNYAGDNDDMIGREGICAPIFRGCMRAQERAAKSATVNRIADAARASTTENRPTGAAEPLSVSRDASDFL